MLPQPNWSVGYQENVDRLVSYLETRTDLRLTKMNWSTGLVLVAKKVVSKMCVCEVGEAGVNRGIC